jgi:hypothetical protein
VGSNPATPTIFLKDFNGRPVEQGTHEMSGKRLVSTLTESPLGPSEVAALPDYVPVDD